MIFLTENIETISEIMNHPKVHRWIGDDCSPSTHNPVTGNNVLYLVDETEKGVVRLDPVNSICCQAHIALMPSLWGKGVAFTKECLTWGFCHTGYIKVMAIIPVFNRLTVKLVQDCGFEQEGLIKESFLKNWRLHDQVLFGLTKKDFSGLERR